ncbi:uncharacterized protein LOC114828751 isoform X2 [Esox lucius]|uniref:uncharacterized protein LOC114828751 isoform X2 n=1 Tax=Esox lucius TaxID=8010 RepID=UPI0014770506|nr:uncharacterized protein LOC114828751 isoform X2 [Esox lucius]
MYIVAEFTESKTVNIISDSWFEDGVTLWPNYKSDERINRAVRKHEVPGSDWKMYDVRVLSRAGDYQKAREKLRASLTCNTSELHTDGEQEVVVARKRKIKPRLIFGDTDSESEPEERNNTRPTYLSLTPAPPIAPPTPNFSARPLPDPNHAELLHSTAAAPLVPVPPPCMPSSPPCQISAGPLPDLRQCDRGSYTAPVALVPTPTSRMPSSPRRRITATLTNDYQGHCFVPTFRLGRTGTGPVPCSAAELHILTLLEHIKEQQMQLAAAVNNIAARMGTETPMAEMPQNVSVPLATMSEVEEFEEWLKDARNSHAKQNMRLYGRTKLLAVHRTTRLTSTPSAGSTWPLTVEVAAKNVPWPERPFINREMNASAIPHSSTTDDFFGVM